MSRIEKLIMMCELQLPGSCEKCDYKSGCDLEPEYRKYCPLITIYNLACEIAESLPINAEI